MPKPTNAPISCLMRPSDAWKTRLGMLLPQGETIAIERVLNATDAVDRLAEAMERALEAGMSSDGRVDMKTAAAHLLRDIMHAQKGIGGK